MGKLKSYQEQLQDIVEKGINAAEEQQKKLSSKPFEYAEKLESEAREYSVKNLRTRYYGYSESLFDQLRSLNSRVGSFAADLVAKLEKEAAEGADSVVGSGTVGLSSREQAGRVLPIAAPPSRVRISRRLNCLFCDISLETGDACWRFFDIF